MYFIWELFKTNSNKQKHHLLSQEDNGKSSKDIE